MNSEERLDYLFIVALFNEAAILERSVALLRSYLETYWPKRDSRWRIALLDNGSTDGTKEAAEAVVRLYPERVTYFFTPEPGRGQALRTIVRRIPARRYFVLDADIPLELADVNLVLKPLKENAADIVVGKRSGKRPLKRRFLSWGVRFTTYLLFDLRLNDPQCGVLAFNQRTSSVLDEATRETGYFLNTELLARSREHSLRLAQAPIHWIEQRYADRQSKIRFWSTTKEGFGAMLRIALRFYPYLIVHLILFLGAGAMLVTLFILNKTSVAQSDFSVAHHLPSVLPALQAYTLLMAIAFGFMACVVMKMRKAPWQLFLVIALTIFVIVGVIAVLTPPTRSQDLYWSLLLTKGFSRFGLNPYHTTPLLLRHDPWASPLVIWKNLPMTHGPLWVLFLTPFSLFDRLGAALFSTKAALLLVLSAAGVLFWRIMETLEFSLERKTKLIALMALNPFIIQTTLVDGHSDTLLLVAFLASYLFFLKGRYALSIIPLLLGGFVKYVPWLLIPLPLAYLVKKNSGGARQTLRTLTLLAVGGIAAALFLYWPFGFSLKNFTGLATEVSQRQYPGYAFPGSAFVASLPALDPGKVRLIGVVLALAVLWYCIKRDKPFWGYVAPYGALFFFGTPWFQPWYALWILPLAALRLPAFVIVAASIALLLMQDVAATLPLSLLALLFVAIYYLFRASSRLLLHLFHTSSPKRTPSATP